MKKDFYPDRTICSLQIELKKDYKDIINYITEFMPETILAKTLLDKLKTMQVMSKSIHYKATRMEKRLHKYRGSIESLGFKRV